MVDVGYTENGFIAYISFNYGESAYNSKTLWSITGDWRWGQRLGMCDGTYFMQKDLTTQIKKWIQYNRAVLYGVTWTSVNLTPETFVSSDGINVYFEDLTPYGVQMYFAYHDFNYNCNDIFVYYCVNQTNCNSYAQETNKALDVIEDNYLEPGYKIKSVGDFNGTVIMMDNCEYGWCTHILKPYMGIPVKTSPQQ